MNSTVGSPISSARSINFPTLSVQIRQECEFPGSDGKLIAGVFRNAANARELLRPATRGGGSIVDAVRARAAAEAVKLTANCEELAHGRKPEREAFARTQVKRRARQGELGRSTITHCFIRVGRS